MITDSGIMTILFYKGLTRNPEIGNTPVWVLPNTCRLGQVMDTKFDTNVSNRMLLNAAKFIQEKPTAGGEGGVKLPSPPPPPRLGLNVWQLGLLKFLIVVTSFKMT